MEEGIIEKDMTPRLIGETFRKYPNEISRQKATYGLFECQYCGKEFECITNSVNTGHTKSCGCQRGKGFKHGLESNRFYSTWNGVIQRCNNPNSSGYYKYGARGITVCEEWLDVKNFVAWAEATHPNISGVSLDRIDNDGAYSPENCRWADKTTQAINQSISKNNTTGFVGISYKIRDGVWVASISVNNTRKHIGSFLTIEEAVLARDNYIIQNNLPHKLSTEYKREDS